MSNLMLIEAFALADAESSDNYTFPTDYLETRMNAERDDCC